MSSIAATAGDLDISISNIGNLIFGLVLIACEGGHATTDLRRPIIALVKSESAAGSPVGARTGLAARKAAPIPA
jgi:hypothetical protein